MITTQTDEAKERSAHVRAISDIPTPQPRVTKTGWLALCKFLVLPFLGLLLVLDVIGYLIARFAFGACYGLLCLI